MGVPYYGDYPEDHTEIRIPFNTFDSNDPSASVTVTDLVDADIEVHADGNTTPIATDGASVIINFASETGSHMVLIDSSADAAYTTATEYAVKVVGVTIDAATVNAWIGTFSIERSGGAIALLKTLTTNVATVDTEVDKIVVATITNAAGVDVSADILVIDNFVDGIETAVVTNAAGADISADILVIDNFVDGLESTIGVAGAGLSDLGGMSTGMKGEVNTEADGAIETYGLDHLISAAVAGADVADNSIIADLVSKETTSDYDDYVNTTDSLQALRDHVGDGTNLTESGGDGDHLTAINLPNQTMDITGDITGSVGSVTAEVTADVTKISGDSTAADRLEALMDGLIVGTVNDASATTTAFAADNFTEATDDHFNGRLITFLTGALTAQQTDITDYDAADGGQGAQEFTVTALTEAPGDGDFFIIH